MKHNKPQGKTDVDAAEPQERSSDLVEALILKAQALVSSAEFKMSAADILRLAQYLDERKGSTVREVQVQWVDTLTETGVDWK